MPSNIKHNSALRRIEPRAGHTVTLKTIIIQKTMDTLNNPFKPNEGSIYLYYQNNAWQASGHSARYLAAMFSGVKTSATEADGAIHLSEEEFMQVLEAAGGEVRVSDEWVEVKATQFRLHTP